MGGCYRMMAKLCGELRERGIDDITLLHGRDVKHLADDPDVASMWLPLSAPVLRPNDCADSLFALLCHQEDQVVAAVAATIDVVPHSLAAEEAACRWPGNEGQRPGDVILPATLPPINGHVATPCQRRVHPAWRKRGIGRRLNHLVLAALYFRDPHVDHVVANMPRANHSFDWPLGARGLRFRTAHDGYCHRDSRHPGWAEADTLLHLTGPDLRAQLAARAS